MADAGRVLLCPSPVSMVEEAGAMMTDRVAPIPPPAASPARDLASIEGEWQPPPSPPSHADLECRYVEPAPSAVSGAPMPVPAMDSNASR